LSPEEPAPRKLPLRRVLAGAFVLPARHLDQVIQQAGIPLLAVIGLSLVTALNGGGGVVTWALVALYLLAIAWLCLCTHRMVLLDSPDAPMRPDGPALKRLGRFALVGGAVWGVFHFVRLILIGIIMTAIGSRYVAAGEAPSSGENVEGLVFYADLAASAVLFLLVGRLALLLPAIAVDRPFDLRSTWHATRGNSWRLAVVVGVLPWMLKLALGQLYRGSGATEWAIFQVVLAIMLVIEVVAISLAYRELLETPAGPAPPPTDRPA
jgi:hypothetical protein